MSKTHTAIIVVGRKHAVTGAPEFMVIKYQSEYMTEHKRKPETRFMSGTNKEHPNETPKETAVRKLWEEAGLEIKPEHLRLIGKKPGRRHEKFAYFTEFEACDASLLRRTEVVINGDRMSHPFWLSLAELDWELGSAHHWVYDAAMEEVLAPCA